MEEARRSHQAAAKKLGVSPSEALRQTLEYVATRGALPFKPVLLTADDEALITFWTFYNDSNTRRRITKS
ncbi:type II toxin-antitoxin system RelB/DinJ family antitoxin [Shewanella xiamenensis]|uniref:type II toxin-antitoxin system RelB/DinJ family antitoxin n=1 Tax=Shewanella xiamenensis TaxID=332186 RepID=UPI002E7AD922|nr:type II toxin-antitoxin system RelB/DinJ family antitoxin [Shewanella xiamenensis]MEE1982850.1 type II toxin-antitoxin system RelB/DinJ family antitoxin [Shewanella xiamenensis]